MKFLRSVHPFPSRIGAVCLLAVAGLLTVGLLPAAAQADDPLFARMETEEGNIVLVFYPDLAPFHVDNFVHLSRSGFYDGTAFHRIVPGFVIQGGDPLSKDADPRNDGTGGPTLRDVLNDEEWQAVQQVSDMLATRGYVTSFDGPARVKAEFSETARHVRGTLSMARSRDPDSAGSQFFVCVDVTSSLDGSYTIFGHAFSGMDVADRIVNAEKNPAAGRDAPAVPVHIKTVTIFEGLDGLSENERADWDALDNSLKNQK